MTLGVVSACICRFIRSGSEFRLGSLVTDALSRMRDTVELARGAVLEVEGACGTFLRSVLASFPSSL